MQFYFQTRSGATEFEDGEAKRTHPYLIFTISFYFTNNMAKGRMNMERKFWINFNDFVTYSKGYDILDSNRECVFMTRKEWNGVHYINRWGEYCILLRTGEIIVNPIEVFKKDEGDWILVEITEEAKQIINRHSNGNIVYDRY